MADLTTRSVNTVPINPLTGQPDLRAAIEALAAQYAAQGGNPSARQAPIPAPPPSMSRGAQVTVPSSQTIPEGWRPDVAFPVPPYMPLLDGQFDPITGQTRLTPQQVMANAAAVPSHRVVKEGDGRPVRQTSIAAGDPSIPKLTPLWGDSTAAPVAPTKAAQVPAAPYQKGGAIYYPPGPDYGYNSVTQEWEVKRPGNAYTQVTIPPGATLKPMPPSQAVAAIDGTTPPLPLPRPAMGVPSLPMPPRAPNPAPRPASRAYAGIEQTPSLFPPVDPNILAGMNALRNPWVQLFSLMSGRGSSQTPSGPMLAMNGKPSNFGNPLTGGPPPPASQQYGSIGNDGASGSRSFDGQHFMSGKTPGAYYDADTGWQRSSSTSSRRR